MPTIQGGGIFLNRRRQAPRVLRDAIPTRPYPDYLRRPAGHLESGEFT